MYNPTRRNRNIGTSKQGWGQDNEMRIPESAMTFKCFYENLSDYRKESRVVNGHEFVFVIEKTRKTSFHACSVGDVVKVLEKIPVEDYGEMRWIVFRQPKRKEEMLSLVWGRLCYLYEFENEIFPAVILEAVNVSKKMKWSRRLSVEEQKEFERLRDDGHEFIETRRGYECEIEINNVRRTQLFRTLPHEFGHYLHYLNVVERPAMAGEAYEAWEQRQKRYEQIPTLEKEGFAHAYVDRLENIAFL